MVRDRSGTAVGMGRVIGDGGGLFQVVDMAVMPEHQRRGLGDAILARLLEDCTRRPLGRLGRAVRGPRRGEADARHGFAPTEPDEVGMRLTEG